MKKLLDYLETLGVKRDGLLLIHSAFAAYSRYGHEATKLVQCLCEYMRPGTLLMPTMSWRYVKITQPYFHWRDTPSNTGILTELFRQLPGVQRSVHPTHSLAGIGPLAETILSTHHLSQSPCDEHSPFRKMLEHDATVLMFGVGMDCCTVIHAAEEAVAPQDYLQAEVDPCLYHCVGARQTVDLPLRRHQFLPRNYWQYQDILAANKQLQVCMIDGVSNFVFQGMDLYQHCVEGLKKNPLQIIAKKGERYRMM